MKATNTRQPSVTDSVVNADPNPVSKAVQIALRTGAVAMLISVSPAVLSQDTTAQVIDLSDLDPSEGFELIGVRQYDRSGNAVSDAGDINGDGVDDIIIGAAVANYDSQYAGETYVVFGGGDVGINGTLELSTLDGRNGFVINGAASRDRSGFSVSGAGDVNGDGIADLIIGALDAEVDGEQYAGASYVVFGGPGVGNKGSVELSDLDGRNGFVVKGITSGDYSGQSVGGAGDVNGDGVADLIIGAPGFGEIDGNREGASYVVFGGNGVGNTGSVELSDLNGLDGFVIKGVDIEDQSGRSVSGAGDINDDGVADLIVAAPAATPRDGYLREGISYVVFGGVGVGSTGAVELTDLDGVNGFVMTGIDAGGESGSSVSKAGDVNGDGIADVIIGTRFAGESYVVFGGRGVGSSGLIDLSALDGSNGFVLKGVTLRDRAGDSVSGAGDVNGDGLSDLIVGAPGANKGAGESYVVFGGPDVVRTGVIELSGLNGNNGFAMTGTDQGSRFFSDRVGDSVSGAGDFNGDGVSDVIVGAWGANRSQGSSYVIFGKTTSDTVQCNGLSVTVDLNLRQTPTPGPDVILGTPGDDVIRGLAGNDTICAGAGNDFILGNSGNDWIDGGAGDDRLRGGRGNDTINGSKGNDDIQGNSGDDTISGGQGADRLLGGFGIDTINGNAGSDLINGNAGGDFIFGGTGNDDLRGGTGNDALDGGAGMDFLSGGGGTMDTCDGGSEFDRARVSCETIFNVP